MLKSQELVNSSIEIKKGISLGDIFFSQESGLSRIDILFKGPPRLKGRLTFHLIEAKDLPRKKPDIITLQKSFYKISWNTFIDFEFPPIKSSKNKTYYFYLESNAKNGVKVWLSTRKKDKESFIIKGIPRRGGMVYRIYYKRDKMEVLKDFIKRFAKGKPYNLFILGSYIGFLFITIMILFKGILFGEW